MASAAEVVAAIDHILRYKPDWRGTLNDADFTALNDMYDRAKNHPQGWLESGDLPIHLDDKYLGALRLDNPNLFNGATPIDPTGQTPTQPAGVNGSPAAPPPAAPLADGDFAGRAAQASALVDDALAKNTTAIAEADEELVDAVLGAKTGSQEGQAQLQALQNALVDQIHKLGPTLDTPAGQQQLNDFLQGKTQEIFGIVKSSAMDAESKADVLDALSQRFEAVKESGGSSAGSDAGPGESSSTAGAGGSGQSAGGGGVSDPSGPAELASDPLLTGLASDPLMGGLGALAGPAMGALGGLPGAMGSMMPGMGGFGGGGLPLGDLGGALGSAIRDGAPRTPDDPAAALQDDRLLSQTGDGSPSEAADEDSLDDKSPTADAGTALEEKGLAAEPGDGDQPHAVAAESGQAPPAEPGPDVSVELPDGSTAVAESPQLAHAGRLVLDGASLDDAAGQAKLSMLPAGAPVREPVSPSQLRLMDYAQFTDHRVMALGGDKVWLNGQVTPASEMPTGPNFLGWARPQVETVPSATVLAGAS